MTNSISSKEQLADELDNDVFITVEMLQSLINDTQNIYDRIMFIQSLAGGITPIGAILLWKGTLTSIPTGFQLADGTNGTPDLRGKFLLGLASSETDDDLLEIGGVTEHSHTLGATSQATKHKHTVYMGDATHFVNASSGGNSVAWVYHNHSWSAETSSEDKHTHTGTYSTVSNLPPYEKYYWIARIPA